MPHTSETAIPFTPPMECLPVAKIPEGGSWVCELKLDGYRAQAIRDRDGVRLLSRNEKDLTGKCPLVSRELLEAIEPDTAVDGELTAFDGEGKLSFNALQNAAAGIHVVFFAFDILVSEGKDESHPLCGIEKLSSDRLSNVATMCRSQSMVPWRTSSRV